MSVGHRVGDVQFPRSPGDNTGSSGDCNVSLSPLLRRLRRRAPAIVFGQTGAPRRSCGLKVRVGAPQPASDRGIAENSGWVEVSWEKRGTVGAAGVQEKVGKRRRRRRCEENVQGCGAAGAAGEE
eukprot:gene9863-biopygen6228